MTTLVLAGMAFVAALTAVAVAKARRRRAIAPTACAVRVATFEPEAERPDHVSVADLSFDDDADKPVLPSGGSPAFDLRVSGRSDPGWERTVNEDGLLLLEREDVFAVADGIGGRRGGAAASRIALDAVEAAFRKRDSRPPSVAASLPPPALDLLHAIGSANVAVRRAAEVEDEVGMGTTLVVARFCPEERRAYVSHVGDSRCYRLRDGTLERVTSDHTEPPLADEGSSARVLSRAVGIRHRVRADVHVLVPRAGDVYLLCSDGLTKTVADEEIAAVLVRADDPERATCDLVRLASERGSRDDVTAIVVSVVRASAA